MYIGLWNPEVTIRHFVLKKQIFFLYFSIEMNVGNPNQTTKKKRISKGYQSTLQPYTYTHKARLKAMFTNNKT